jgi:hypothetical protein
MAFTITLSGLTMGAATAGSATGITVQTEADLTASAGVFSGPINSATAQSSQVTSVAFFIASADRVAGKTAVSVTLGFTTTSTLPVGGKITLNYPSGFFAPTTTPWPNTAGTTSVTTMTATSGVPGATSIVITTAGAGLAANMAFTITLSGLTMGAATAGSATGITVQTEADLTASAGVASGGISAPPATYNAALSAPSIVLSKSVKSAASVTATVSFTIVTIATHIKTLTVSGVNFDSSVQPTSSLTCVGLSAGTASLSSDGKALVLSVTNPAAASVFSIICQFAGLKNVAAAAAATNSVSIATFGADGANIDGFNNLAFPAIFNAALTSPSVVMSNSVKGATAVTATVSFTIATIATPIKTVTMSGVNFDSTVQPVSPFTCMGLSSGAASLSADGKALVLSVFTPAVASQTNIICQFAGLKNVAVAAAATTSISVATFGIDNFPIDTISNVFFPAIVEGSSFGVAPSIVTNYSSVSFETCFNLATGLVVDSYMLPFHSQCPVTGIRFPYNALTVPHARTWWSETQGSRAALLNKKFVDVSMNDANGLYFCTHINDNQCLDPSTQRTVFDDSSKVGNGWTMILKANDIYYKVAYLSESISTVNFEWAQLLPPALTFTSITMTSNVAGSTVAPVLQFIPFSGIPVGGTITLIMPAGYFLGSANAIAYIGPAMIASVSAATSSSTTIVLTTSVALVPASGTVIVTMSGLTLGPAQAAVSAGFRMSSSADAALSNGLDAPAIVTNAAVSTNSRLIDLRVTLASNTKATVTTASFTFTPTTAITAGANAGIIITLSGVGIAGFSTDSVCSFTNPPSATCSATGSKVLVVKFLSGTFSAMSSISFVVSKFSTPMYGMPASTNVAAGTFNDMSLGSPVLLDGTTTGTFPAISWLSGLAVTLSSNVKATSTTATIAFTPSTALIGGLHAGLVITLSGSGIALSTISESASTCTVIVPSFGSPTCTVALTDPGPVLKVKLTSGTYLANAEVRFTITKFSTPSAEQAAQTALAAGTSNDLMGLDFLDITNLGTFPEIRAAGGYAISFTSIVIAHIASSSFAGSAVSPVLQFTPLNAIAAGGSITLIMPAGYFLGIAQGSVLGMTTSAAIPANASSTQIVLPIHTFVPASTAVVVSLSGLSLGAGRAAVLSGFRLSSSADSTLSNGLDAPAIVASFASALPPSPSQSDFSQSYPQNALHLSFQTVHLCSFQSVTRNCLLKNASFPSG